MPPHCLIFLCACVALKSENQASPKNADDHGDTTFTKPGSTELIEHGGLDGLRDAPPLGTIKARFPDPPIVQQPFSFKKTPIFTPIHGVHKSLNLDALGGKAGSFFTLPTPVSLSLHLR